MKPARLWASGAGLVFVLSGILLLDAYETSHLWRWHKLPGLFLTELGFGFLIAVVIFVVLEEEANREHYKTVLGYLYGVSPKNRFFEKLEDYVLKQKYYRGKAVVAYKFIQRHDEWLLVQYEVEYSVTNVSREAGTFVPTGGLTKKPLFAPKTRWDGMLGLHKLYVEDEEVPLDKVRISPGRSQHCLLYEADPIPMQRGDTVRIKAIHFLIKHDHDSEVWHAALPGMGIELRIEWTHEMALNLVAEAVHPEPERMKDVLTAANKRKLVLEEPLLISHGIHFWWSRQRSG